MSDASDETAHDSLAPYGNDELVAELGRRCSAMVIGMLTLVDRPNDPPVRMRFVGDRLTCRGLIEDLADHARKVSAECYAGDDDEDDEG